MSKLSHAVPMLFSLLTLAHATTLFDNLGPTGVFINNAAVVSDSANLAALASRFYLANAATVTGVDLVLEGPVVPNQVMMSFYADASDSPGSLLFSRTVTDWPFSGNYYSPPVQPGPYFNPTFSPSPVLLPGSYWLGVSSTNVSLNQTVNWYYNLGYLDKNAFLHRDTASWTTTNDRTFGMRVFGDVVAPEPSSIGLMIIGILACLGLRAGRG